MNKEYVILNLEKEYPGFTGTEKWMIITDLPEEEFEAKYPEHSHFWADSVIVSIEMGKEILRYHNNESKHAMRLKRNEIQMEISAAPVARQKASDLITDTSLLKALDTLTEIQRNRVLSYYGYGNSIQDIAEVEGRSVSSIHKSLTSGIKRMQKFMVPSYTGKESDNE